MKITMIAKNNPLPYKILATLISFFFFLSGYWEVTKNVATYPKTIQMGYPPYFITALGIAKMCGAITLILPNLRKLKEWVFIGFLYDIVFAFISGASCNLPLDCIKAAVAFLFVGLTYFLFSTERKTSPQI